MADEPPNAVELRPAGAWTEDDAAGLSQAMSAFGATIGSVSVEVESEAPEAELAFGTTAAAAAFLSASGGAKTAVRDRLLVRLGPVRLLTVRYPNQLADFDLEYAGRYADRADLDLVFQLMATSDDLVRSACRSRHFPLDTQGPARLQAELERSPSGPVWRYRVWRDVPAPNRFAGRRSFRATVPATSLPPWSTIGWTPED